MSRQMPVPEEISSEAVALQGTEVWLEVAPTISFVAEQAGVPVVRSCAIRHRGPDMLKHAELELRLEPRLSEPQRVAVPDLFPLEEHDLGPIDIRLPPGKLRQVEEAERARLAWTLRNASGQVLAEGDEDVEVLPYNHWPGLRAPPGLLASFVTPNHKVVAQILKRVSRRLEEATGSSAIDGYQSRNPERVRAMVRALYDEIASLGISYIEAPASFAGAGQKVRLPDQVLAEQLGCCLDLSVLFASCLEQMGLAPLLVVVEGHAFLAVWLVDDRFPEGLVEDAARLRTQLDLGQMLAFESTLVTSGGSFDHAVAQGRRGLLDDERYLFALDVRGCRSAFRPLPLRDVAMEVEEGEEPAAQRIEIVRILREAKDAPDEAEVREAVPEGVAARFARWKDRLLDLTLRNRLLNFRPDRREVLPLEIPDVAAFEDLLATNEQLEIVGQPVSGVEGRRRPVRERLSDEAERARLLKDLARRVLHSPLPQDRLERQAIELFREARTDLEEGGASTLFVSIGMLKWIEPGTDLERFAPLILYPVQIVFDRGRKRVAIRRLPGEDPVANVTLIEKMRRDLGIDLSALARLDQDDAGLDVRTLLDGVRRQIQGRAGFEVLEEVHVSRLAFSKFLMWKDLEDNAHVLLDNPVVRHVADLGAVWNDPVGDVDPNALDEVLAPHALPTVLDADSTQLAAVAAALRGRSFVLQGPPGTGKSQTITNLIAAALAEGKTVLFVSEKMAALEVVHRRLQSVGLGDFCLELHSHKSNKKDVLASFDAVLGRKPTTAVEGWEAQSRRLDELRQRLNRYARALHRKHASGFSVYEASARLRELLDVPEVRIPLENPGDLTAERIRELQDVATEVADRGQAVEPLKENPWRISRKSSYSLADEEAVADALKRALAAIDQLSTRAEALGRTLGISAPPSITAIRRLARLGQAAADGALPAQALSADWSIRAGRARAWLEADRAIEKQKAEILERWQPAIFDVDLAPHIERFHRWAGSPFARLFLWKSRRKLAALARGRPGADAAVRDDLVRIASVVQERRRLDAERAEHGELLDPGLLARGDVVSDAASLGRDALETVVHRSASHGPERRGILARQADELLKALDECEAAIAAVRSAADLPEEDLPLPDDPSQLPRLLESFRSLRTHLPGFRAHCLFREAAERLERLGHAPLVEAFAQGKVRAAEIPRVLERNLLARWLSAVIDAEPVLRTFDRPSHERMVTEFTDLDRRHIELSRQFVIASLERRLPSAVEAAAHPELQLLRREIGKKARHMAVRRLLQSLPTMLPRLKPCLLMSPLSVAQYLPAATRFDLVVFDEASQIGTHDAIGTLARGKQVVVVGDSRQLPPTTFFQRTGASEDDLPDENDVAEVESILEEVAARGLPQLMLGWHYRSRHESLIDFSNRHYYDGRLFILPAARHRVEDLGVKWHPVPDGVYVERVNRKEAEALVRYLVERLRTTSPKERSFGVVTFSLSQRKLIEDLLDEARVDHPEIEPHFTSEEPVFVKNLENVQGDERDEILFSVGYARDEMGRLRMQFGPLSNAGGERRLNVAITRARCQLRIFSTLRPEDIDLSRTQSVGAAHLRAFLQYAGRGARSQERTVNAFESPYHREIYTALTSAGYKVATSVGCAGYRVDLAVERPDRPGTYLLGIELDGPRWAAAGTARDRERLRKEVLASLGWKIVSVWTPEWARNPKGEAQRLLDEIGRHLALSRGVA